MSIVHTGSHQARLVRGFMLAVGLVVMAMFSLQAQAEAAERQFRMNEAVEFKFGGMWQEGVIKRVGGELYLVARPQFRMEAAWDWMPAEMIRPSLTTYQPFILFF